MRRLGRVLARNPQRMTFQENGIDEWSGKEHVTATHPLIPSAPARPIADQQHPKDKQEL